MPKTLVMFPGQGSQYVGMANELEREFPVSRFLFEEAEDALRFPLRKLMRQGPESQLRLTAYAQPATLVTSYAHWQVVSQETAVQDAWFAGHSLGEITALVAACKLSFAEALRLVRRRAHAMQAAFPEQHASMAAVINVPQEVLFESLEAASGTLMDAHNLPPLMGAGGSLEHMVDLSAINSRHQMVVAGSKDAIRCLQKITARKIGELQLPKSRFVPLAVSVPFHSRYMIAARRSLEELFRTASWQQSGTKVIPNVTGQICGKGYGAEELLAQIHQPVQWLKTFETSLAHQITRFIEVGSATVLQKMWAREPLPEGSLMEGTKDLTEFVRQHQSHEI